MMALQVAKDRLPTYAHVYSPRKFTQPQLFACLVLKRHFKLDYRGIVALLADMPTLCEDIRLKSVPHYTTLQKAAHRLLGAEKGTFYFFWGQKRGQKRGHSTFSD